MFLKAPNAVAQILCLVFKEEDVELYPRSDSHSILIFEVNDLKEAIKEKNVIIQPNSPSPGVIVAFIEDNGVPIEFLQIDRTIAEDGI